MGTSVITHTQTDPFGIAVQYVANFRLTTAAGQQEGFRLSDGTGISAVATTTSNGSGSISVALENNSNIVPAGSFYVAELLLPSSAGGTQEAGILSSSSVSPQSIYSALINPIPSYVPFSTVPASVLAANNIFTGTNQFNGNVTFSGIPFFSVRRYGAVGNGTTDDLAAIQAAVAACIAAGGGIVWFDRGTYAVSGSIVINAASASVCLQGPSVSNGARIKPVAGFTDFALIDVGDAITLCERWAVRGLDLTGRDTAGNLVTISGIRARKTAQWEITDNYFGQFNKGIELGTTAQVGLIADNVIGSANKVGIYGDVVDDLRIIGNDLEEGTVGGGTNSIAIQLVRWGPNVVIANNKINNFEGFGIDVGAFAADYGPGLITGNAISDTAGGIHQQEDGGCIVSSNEIRGLKSGFAISVAAADTSVTSNVITNVPSRGIDIGQGNCVVVGNLIRNCVGIAVNIGGVGGTLVNGNQIYATSTSTGMTVGITEAAGTVRSLIVGNILHSTQVGFVAISSGTDANTIIANNSTA